MFSNSNQVGAYTSNYSAKTSRSEPNVEILLNPKIYYLNNSLSKFVCVGLSISDFKPRIRIGGQNGFNIIINEEEWKELQQNQGVLANYFYSSQADTYPLKIGSVTVNFEKMNFEKMNQTPIIKIQKFDGSYVCLGKESVDKLIEVDEIVDYRIQIIKKQEFEKYFSLFQTNTFSNPFNLSENVYNVLNPSQNPNSENVSTMLEMLMLHPKELECKIKNGFSSKRKYYEEIGAY